MKTVQFGTSQAVMAALKSPCPARVTCWGFQDDQFEVSTDLACYDTGSIQLTEPVAQIVERIFIRLHPERKTSRKPNWLRS